MGEIFTSSGRKAHHTIHAFSFYENVPSKNLETESRRKFKKISGILKGSTINLHQILINTY